MAKDVTEPTAAVRDEATEGQPECRKIDTQLLNEIFNDPPLTNVTDDRSEADRLREAEIDHQPQIEPTHAFLGAIERNTKVSGEIAETTEELLWKLTWVVVGGFILVALSVLAGSFIISDSLQKNTPVQGTPIVAPTTAVASETITEQAPAKIGKEPIFTGDVSPKWTDVIAVRPEIEIEIFPPKDSDLENIEFSRDDKGVRLRTKNGQTIRDVSLVPK